MNSVSTDTCPFPLPDNTGHFWDIAPPSGSTSTGVCRKCGAVKEHRNSSSYQPFREMPVGKDTVYGGKEWVPIVKVN